MSAASYPALERRFQRISRIYHMLAIGKWDEAVNMPSGGGKARADALVELSTMRNELLHDPQLADDIANAEKDTTLDAWQQANVREIKRIHHFATAIPIALESAFNQATLETEQAWRSLRKQNDWATFQPLLRKVVDLSRERAACLADRLQCEPYAALMQLYQTGFSIQDIDNCFAVLKQELPILLQQILQRQQHQHIIPIQGTFPTERQQALSQQLMSQLGFDFNHGRLDVTHHPFCGGVPQDTRIATRYYEHDFMEAIMGTIHETGHGRYEQGLPNAWLEQPVGGARGMAIHESQSLLFEMQIGRSQAFLTFLQPLLQHYFGKHVDAPDALALDNLIRVYRRVEPGLIRTSADEVTYPLHIILRYEIEKDLIQGKLAVDDIPERWDLAMQSLLGISTRNNFKDGCMQDVHWPSGAFGYFPFYTLGALLAAQLKASMTAQLPDLDSCLNNGDIRPVANWLEQHIWGQGCLFDSQALIASACGAPLSADSFLQHLQTRYLEEVW